MSKNLLEVRQYDFEHCTIMVKLDRREKKLSFVEWNDKEHDYVDKDWRFAGRDRKYMNGWLYILQAMQYVIDDCKKEMDSWYEEETNKLIALILDTSEEAKRCR